MIAIIDYGVGNLSSIKNMIRKAGGDAIITSDKTAIVNASKIIIPGIGHFDHCMKQFNESGLKDLITDRVLNDKVPVLGVCVGCQMLMDSSEEGNEKGLGWISGQVVRFQKDKMPEDYKIPHMGWSDTKPIGSPQLYEALDTARFYYVHSFHLAPTDPSVVTAVANYGYSFPASVGKETIQGVQFHPEKSHKFGMKLYSNFIKNF